MLTAWSPAAHVRSETGSTRYPRLEAIVGPMFCGKSAELIRRVRLAEIAHLGVRVFRPALDTRAPEMAVSSRNGLQTRALGVPRAEEIRAQLDDTVDLVAVDEAEFFDDELESVVRELLVAQRRVIVAGLDLDFAGQPFGSIPRLLALADSVDKLTAVCMVCHSLFATRTQRLIDGDPAPAGRPLIVVDQRARRLGYQARCRGCYRPPV